MRKTWKASLAMGLAVAMTCGMLTGCGGSSKTAENTAAGTSGSTAAGTTAAGTSAGTESGTAGTSADTDYSDIVVTYGLGSPWTTLNPYSTNAGGLYAGLVQDKIYDKLFYIEQGGKSIRPRNAESWEMKDNVMTIKLNQAAKWQDGEPVTANDWVFTFNLLVNPEVPYSSRSNMNIFEGTNDDGVLDGELGIKAADDYTLEMTFKKSWDVVDLVGTKFKSFVVLPEHILGSVAPAQVLDDAYFMKPVGSGPCIYDSEVVDSSLTLLSNPDYYLGAPKFGKMVMQVVSAANVVTSVLAGELDYNFPFLSVDNYLAAEDEGMTVDVSETANKLNMMIINNKTITDSKIRLAMQYAIDKQTMVDSVMLGKAVVAESAILPDSQYLNKELPSGRDVEKAKALLAEAGYNGEEYTIAVPSGYRVQLASMIQQNFADAGINLKIETVDAGTMFDGVQSGDYDMIIMADTMSDYYLSAEWYYDSTAANYGNVSDSTLNDKMNEIKACTDEAQIKELMDDFQEYCFEQSPMIPLFFQYNFALKSERLSNIVPFDSQMFNDAVWEWNIAK